MDIELTQQTIRGRGRPKKANALSGAERMRKYREKLKKAETIDIEKIKAGATTAVGNNQDAIQIIKNLENKIIEIEKDLGLLGSITGILIEHKEKKKRLDSDIFDRLSASFAEICQRQNQLQGFSNWDSDVKSVIKGGKVSDNLQWVINFLKI